MNVILNLDDEMISKIGLSQEELKIELAIALYKRKKLSMGQASKLADLSLIDFQFELGNRNETVNYDLEAFKADLETLNKLKL